MILYHQALTLHLKLSSHEIHDVAQTCYTSSLTLRPRACERGEVPGTQGLGARAQGLGPGPGASGHGVVAKGLGPGPGARGPGAGRGARGYVGPGTGRFFFNSGEACWEQEA